MASKRDIVGVPIRRADAVEKVTGRAQFGTDLRVPGMVYAKLLRSPLAHARINSIDTSAAASLPGVLRVAVGRDVTGCRPYFGPAFPDQPILAIDEVLFEGEPVAAVVATDEDIARRALELIDVDYDPLPALDMDMALRPDAPLLHAKANAAGHFKDLSDIGGQERSSNVCHESVTKWGDVAAGFAEADRIFEHTFTFPAVAHVSLEPYVTIAHWDGPRLEVWSSTQHAHPVRAELAEIFGLSLQQVRVVVPYIGGAYGAKCYTKYEPLASYLAREVGLPVRLMEDPFHTLTRHAASITIKSGVKLDGTITARESDVNLDTGAYSDIGPRVANKTSYRTIGPYRIPNVLSRARAIFTNHVPAGAFRGYGAPQGQWAVESHMDLIAEELGLDPLEFRMKNLVGLGERWNPTDTPIDGDFRQGLGRVAERFGWPMERSGIAVGVKDGGGRHTIAQATVRVHNDGTATVQADAVEMGQGIRTVLAQIAAEELGLPFTSVHVTLPDTDAIPWDQGVSASRGTTVVGKAVWEAAHACRQRLEGEGGLDPAAKGQEALSDTVRRIFDMPGGEVVGHGVVKPGSFGPGATTYWEAGYGAAQVSVDEQTGVIRLDRYITGADIGLAINPDTAEGQDEGAALMGIGHSLFEELVYQDGQLLNGNLIEYRVPTFSDVPETFESILIENEDGPGPFGCKGVGESGIVPVAPAIANAVARACGVRLFDLPLTPERVWRALAARKGAPAPSETPTKGRI